MRVRTKLITGTAAVFCCLWTLELYGQDAALIEKTLSEALIFQSQAGSPDHRTQVMMHIQIDSMMQGLNDARKAGSLSSQDYSVIAGGAGGTGFYMKQPDVRGKQEWAVVCADVVKLLHDKNPQWRTNIDCPTAEEPPPPKRVGEFWPDPTIVVRSFARERVGIPLDGYEVPGLVALLYEGNFDKIPDDLNTRGYIASFSQSYIDRACPKPENAGWQLAHYIFFYVMRARDQSLSYDNGFGASPLNMDTVNRNFDATLQMLNQGGQIGKIGGVLRQDGANDGNAFLKHYGCSDPHSQRMFENQRAVIHQRLTMPPDVPNNEFFRAQAAPGIKPNFPFSDDQSRLGRTLRRACEDSFPTIDPGIVQFGQESDCRCEALMLIQSGVPESDLNALTAHSDFFTSLQSIAQKNPNFARQHAVCRLVH